MISAKSSFRKYSKAHMFLRYFKKQFCLTEQIRSQLTCFHAQYMTTLPLYSISFSSIYMVILRHPRLLFIRIFVYRQ